MKTVASILFFIASLHLKLHSCSTSNESEEDSYESHFLSSPIELTNQNFTDALKTDNFFVVFFWSKIDTPGNTSDTVDTVFVLSEIFNVGNNTGLTIASVDCSENNQTCIDNGIFGVPEAEPYILMLFKINEIKGISYTDSDNFIHSVHKFLKQHIDFSGSLSKDVVELTDKNYKEQISNGTWFIDFYFPWCIHAKNLEPIWNKLPSVLEKNISLTIGKVDCKKYAWQICSKYPDIVFGTPALLWVENEKRSDQYKGIRTVKSLKSYVESKLESMNTD